MADDAGRLNSVLAETSFLYGSNAEFVEDLHARWAADPSSVEPSWRAFFASLADNTDAIRHAGERRPDAGSCRKPVPTRDRRPVAGDGRR
jgi:2-oxoglutarate dehydrogenase E1 component